MSPLALRTGRYESILKKVLGFRLFKDILEKIRTLESLKIYFNKSQHLLQKVQIHS